MTAGPWQRLWELYEAAGALPDHEWQDYLERNTNDPGLRAQVLEMLRNPQSSMAASQPAAPAIQVDRAGSRIGRYQIGKQIGQGGMGEVYAASDIELDRPVALKFVASSRAGKLGLSLDDVLREARAASALNHPHIVTVHEVIPDESGLVIVMERIAGSSMRSICGAPVAPGRAAVYIQQVAQALAAAHSTGIVHRDVKPENLMVRNDGYVKLLDFGLAKTISGASGAGESSTAGTLRYMSPEQVRGETPDPSSDIFSLGIVLYEMLTGQHPFAAASLLQTMRAIATAAPPKFPAGIPPQLSALTLQMLSREPRQRPAAAEVAARLSALPPKALRRRTLAVVGAATAAGVSAAGIWYASKGRISKPALTNATPLASLPGTESQPTFSPDGREIAFTFRPDRDWNARVYRKLLAGGPVTRITGDTAAELDPAWSPDGKQFAYLRLGSGKRGVMVVPVSGGQPRKIGEIAEREHGFSLLCWQPDSRGLVVTDVVAEGTLELALYSLPVDGGDRRQLTNPPPGRIDAIPRYSPDGRYLAFVRLAENGAGEPCILPSAGGPVRPLNFGRSAVAGLAWTPDSRFLVIVSNRSGGYRFWRVPLEGSKAPERIEGTEGNVYELAISRTGERVAYRTAGYSDVNIWRYPVASHDQPVQLIASTGFENDARYSPDGSRIVFGSSRTDGRAQIWICAADGTNPLQLTHFGPDQMVTGSPSWSPDGQQIAFDARLANSPAGIFVIDANGRSGPRRLTGPGPTDIIPAWSNDGRWVYFSSDRAGRMEVWRVPASGGGPPEQVTRHGGFEVFPTPDGRYLYYTKAVETEGIWRLPVAGGDEEFVPELKPVARHRYWQGTPEGIYFMDLAGDRMIRLFRFSTRRVTAFSPAPAPPVPRFRGLTVAPDGRSFLYMQYDVRRSAIMLADRIRE